MTGALDVQLRTVPATARTVLQGELQTTSHERHEVESLPEFAVTNLDFDLTESCNLGCVYCFKGEKYRRDMSPETMRHAFDWLVDASRAASGISCNFMGGEPTLRFVQLREFVPWALRRARARGKRVTFSMTTNLTLFTDEIRRFVDEYGFGVLMSIDGEPAVQDAQRPTRGGKPTSRAVEYWARSMLQTRPRSQARATLTPAGVPALASSVRYLRDVGFQEMAISAASYGQWTDSHFEMLRAELAGIVDEAVSVLATPREFHLTAFKFYVKHLVRLRRTGREDQIQFHPQPCGAGKGYLMVDFVGDLWPCHRFDGADTAAGARGAFRLGNIYQRGFNRRLQRAFFSFDHQRMTKPGCTTCPVHPVCGGYCPAANLADTGCIYTPHDSFCRWSRELYTAAEAIYDRAEDRGSSYLNHLLAASMGATSTGDR